MFTFLKALIVFTICLSSLSVAVAPPVANPVSVTVVNSQTQQIQLYATDDGLPGPLLYIITSLPLHGKLTEPVLGDIVAVPHILQNGLSTVTYEPCPYAQGPDAFSYVANDGGTAPEGGDSNIADVTLAFQFNYDQAIHDTSSFSYQFPFYTIRDDCRLQLIYLAEEFGVAKKITAVELKLKKAPSMAMSNFTLRMQHTGISDYGTDPNFINNGWTTVYQGTLTITAAGWYRFNLQTPFYYNGTDNVLFDISYNNSSHSYAYGEVYTFYATNRGVSQFSNSLSGDPLFWTASMFTGGCTVQNSIPAMKLHGENPAEPVLSDFNTNCSVELEDLEALMSVWMSQQGDGIFVDLYDISMPADQTINLADFAVFAGEWQM